MGEVKKKYEVGNHYTIIDNIEKTKNNFKVIENIRDVFIVFRDLDDSTHELIFVTCDLTLQGNNDIKYIYSKLNWIIKLGRNGWSDNSKFKEEDSAKLNETIMRMNEKKELRHFPIMTNFYNMYKLLSE